MNYVASQRRRFVMILAICGGISVASLILSIGSSMYLSSLEQDLMMLRAQRAGMEATYTQVEDQYKAGKEDLITFEKINPAKDPLFGTLDRKNATILLEQLNQKYKLKNLSLDISPAALQSQPPYKRKTAGVNTSAVKIVFDSVTDEYAYAFLRDIIAGFPGFKRLHNLILTKNGYIDAQIIYALREGEIPPHVKGELAFDWFGLEEKHEPIPPTAPAAVAVP